MTNGSRVKPQTRVVGYIRVSTEEQAREGVSLAAQRERLTAYAVALDLELVTIYEDAGISAKTLERPGLTAALADLDAGRAEGLVVYKLDRLTRDLGDWSALLRRYFVERCALLSVSESMDTRSAAGRLQLNILMTVAAWEREIIGERTAEALRHLKAQGVRIGGVGLGLRRLPDTDADGHRLVAEDPDAVATVQRIRELRDAGESLRSICATLVAEGRRTQRGGRWQPGTIAKVLQRGGPAEVAA
jgi:DNA invertase Pin-like site-specific DNA recombinase